MSLDLSDVDRIAQLAQLEVSESQKQKRLRDDAVTEENHRSEYQASAPAVENGLYLVPKVIE